MLDENEAADLLDPTSVFFPVSFPALDSLLLLGGGISYHNFNAWWGRHFLPIFSANLGPYTPPRGLGDRPQAAWEGVSEHPGPKGSPLNVLLVLAPQSAEPKGMDAAAPCLLVLAFGPGARFLALWGGESIKITWLKKMNYLVGEDESFRCKLFGIRRSSGWSTPRCLEHSKIFSLF